jgi:hypothetical protein
MEYNYTAPSGDQNRHMWTLKGPKGGVHVWAKPNSPDWIARWGDHFVGGVERHSPVPVYDMDDKDKPHHDDCFLLNGPCWHDGTSLYFQERIEPMLRGEQPFSEFTHNFVNGILLDFYESNFGEVLE